MILADTSAWIELLRGGLHPAAGELKRLIRAGRNVAISDVILMEVLAGAPRDDVADLRKTLISRPVLAVNGVSDFEEAAALYRSCRRAGTTIRRLNDCLIAVTAMHADAAVLHKDRDFDAIARHAPLRIHPLDR